MSRQDDTAKRRRKIRRRLIIAGVIVLVVGIGGYKMFRQFQSDTQSVIHNDSGTTHAYTVPESTVQKFDEDVFSLTLPADWKLVKHDSSGPYNLYAFQSTLKNADNRYLDVYIDRLPQELPVNKIVAVKSQGNILSHGQMSDNCTSFTPGAPKSNPSGTSHPLILPSQWDGVPFLCDTDNIYRNVIGTSSPGSINKVALTGQTAGRHNFFFVYTDDNYTPDDTILYDMLDSFSVK